jgi:hypothetical protein
MLLNDINKENIDNTNVNDIERELELERIEKKLQGKKDESLQKKEDEHILKLENKKLDHKLALDKNYLKKEKHLESINRKNQFILDENKVNNNKSIKILASGKKIGKWCLILTIVTTLLTLGGNWETFIFNKRVEDDVLHYTFTGFEIAIPFILAVVALQTVLYMVSLNKTIIRQHFIKYKAVADLIQFLMLCFSVYNNYKFFAQSLKPETVLGHINIFFPALMIDVACIFLIGLSQDQKQFNYHDSEVKTEKTILEKLWFLVSYPVVNFINKRYNKVNQGMVKNKVESTEEKNPVSIQNSKEEVSQSTKDLNQKDSSKTAIKKASEKALTNYKTRVTTGKSKTKLPVEKIIDYLEKTYQHNTKIDVRALKNRYKLSKYKWDKIRNELIQKSILRTDGQMTFYC